MKSNSTELTKQINFLVYSTPQEDVTVNAIIKNESIWLSQKSMAELFECSTDNIGLHLKNIYETEELQKDSTIEEISVVRQEGTRSVKRNVTFYNLDAIIYLQIFFRIIQGCLFPADLFRMKKNGSILSNTMQIAIFLFMKVFH